MIDSEFGGSLELIKLEIHEPNHLRILRGMRVHKSSSPLRYPMFVVYNIHENWT